MRLASVPLHEFWRKPTSVSFRTSILSSHAETAVGTAQGCAHAGLQSSRLFSRRREWADPADFWLATSTVDQGKPRRDAILIPALGPGVALARRARCHHRVLSLLAPCATTRAAASCGGPQPFTCCLQAWGGTGSTNEAFCAWACGVSHGPSSWASPASSPMAMTAKRLP